MSTGLWTLDRFSPETAAVPSSLCGCCWSWQAQNSAQELCVWWTHQDPAYNKSMLQFNNSILPLYLQIYSHLQLIILKFSLILNSISMITAPFQIISLIMTFLIFVQKFILFPQKPKLQLHSTSAAHSIKISYDNFIRTAQLIWNTKKLHVSRNQQINYESSCIKFKSKLCDYCNTAGIFHNHFPWLGHDMKSKRVPWGTPEWYSCVAAQHWYQCTQSSEVYSKPHNECSYHYLTETFQECWSQEPEIKHGIKIYDTATQQSL